MQQTSLPIVQIHKSVPVDAIGIVGSGIMGQGIARSHVEKGYTVLINDASQESCDRVTNLINHQTELGTAIACADLNDFPNADLVIESIVESLSIKRRVLSRIEKSLHEDAILATNTSSIPITKLALRLERPEQFCGVHFFYPADKMELVEVIRGEKTSQQTIDYVVEHVKSIGKIPVVVKDNPGFVVNRFLSLYLDSSLTMLREGANPLEIDLAAEQFGMPFGPLKFFDAIGIDTATRVGHAIQSAYPERLSPSEMLFSMYEAEYLGQKNGRGFYLYDHHQNRLPQIDPFVKKLIAEHVVTQKTHTVESITERLFLPQLVDATRLAEEQLVERAEEIDTCIVKGLGFPTSKAGILAWGDKQGAMQIVQSLEKYQALGESFQPTQTMLECANANSSLIQRCNQILKGTTTTLLKAG